MSGASRVKDASDYDLERFVEMFDQALTSDDPRVKNALRQLMMMVILTDTDSHEGEQKVKHDGPLRRMQQDMRDQFRWIQRLENELESLKKQMAYNETQTKIQSESGFKAQSVSPSEYWQKAISQTNMLKPQGLENIPTSALQGLNIKVAADTGEK